MVIKLKNAVKLLALLVVLLGVIILGSVILRQNKRIGDLNLKLNEVNMKEIALSEKVASLEAKAPTPKPTPTLKPVVKKLVK